MKIVSNTKIFDMQDLVKVTGYSTQTIAKLIRDGGIEPPDERIGLSQVWGEAKFKRIEKKFRNWEAA